MSWSRIGFRLAKVNTKMGCKLKLAVIIIAAIGIASIVSHFSVRWLKIKASWGSYQGYGSSNVKQRAILHGSSIAYAGIDWNQVSEVLGKSIDSWATPGSTPSEWEQMHCRAPDAVMAFVVISPAELNEYSLCDSRAAIVPLSTTIRDLNETHAEWHLCTTTLRQYPLTLMRQIFPTLGRSDGVMVGIRSKLQMLFGGLSKVDRGDAPIFDPSRKSEDKETVSAWSEARLQRRLVSTRTTFGKYSFVGTKKLALERLLQQTRLQGQVILIVMPLPPVFQREFISANVRSEFEYTLANLESCCPEAVVIRLDQLSDLNNNDLYSDLFHLNMYGQQLCTEALLRRFKALRISR